MFVPETLVSASLEEKMTDLWLFGKGKQISALKPIRCHDTAIWSIVDYRWLTILVGLNWIMIRTLHFRSDLENSFCNHVIRSTRSLIMYQVFNELEISSLFLALSSSNAHSLVCLEDWQYNEITNYTLD